MRAISSLASGFPGTMATLPDFAGLQHFIGKVQSQSAFPVVLIRAMTVKAVVRKQRADVPVVAQWRSVASARSEDCERERPPELPED
jgi:hypothetical protein